MKIALIMIGIVIVIAGIGWGAVQKQTIAGERGVVQQLQEAQGKDAVDAREADGGVDLDPAADSAQVNAITEQEQGTDEEAGGIVLDGVLPANVEKELPAVCGDYEPVIESVPTPDFTLDDRNGATVTLASYKGHKPVILDFWNTWCHNCQRDMPQLNTLYNTNRDAVEVLGINILSNNDRASAIDRFVTSNGIDFPILIDRDGSVANQYGVRFTSTKVFINKDGTAFDVFVDDITKQQLQCFTEFNA